MRTTEYSTTVKLDGIKHEHDIDICLAYSVGCSGIGWYEYWGAKCYDAGQPCVEDYEIDEAYIVRSCFVKGRHVPTLSGISSIRRTADGYVYTHRRPIPIDHPIVEEAGELFVENYQPDEDF